MKLTDFLPAYRKLAQSFWEMSDDELDNTIDMLDMQLDHLKDREHHLSKELGVRVKASPMNPTGGDWFEVTRDHEFTVALRDDLRGKVAIARRVKEGRK